jgi:hypothetical protein
VDNHITPVYKQLCVFSLLCTTLRPEDGRSRPKHVVTICNKIQNQDSCVFRPTLPPSFETKSLSAVQEFPLFYETHVHQHIRNSLPVICILSQMNPILIPRDLFLAHSLPKKEIKVGLRACMSPRLNC